MKKTMVEILIETGNSYTKKTRALNPKYTIHNGLAKCLYNAPNGVNCGVARCCVNPKDDLYSYENKPVDEIFGLDSILKPEYKGYPMSFWKDVQMLHDSDQCWDEQGLSQRGKQELQYLCGVWAKFDS